MVALLAAISVFAQHAEPSALEAALQTRLANTTLGSSEFTKALTDGLHRCGAQIEWQKSFGPSPFRIGLVSSSGTTQFAERFASLAIWTSNQGLAVQELDELQYAEGQSSDDAKDGLEIGGEAYRSGDRLVRCGWATDGANYDWPFARVYRLERGRWVVKATEANDEDMGCLPGTHFLRRDGRIDPNAVIATLEVYPKHLSQPHVGPLLRYNQKWVVNGNQISRGKSYLVPTPLSELDELASLAQAGRRRPFNSLVPRAVRGKLWRLLQNQITVFCPHDVEYSDCDTLSVWEDGVHEMGSPNVTLHFAKRKRRWSLVRLSQAQRS